MWYLEVRRDAYRNFVVKYEGRKEGSSGHKLED
jgi:hypothetical protein